jgi:Photoprotection regulator fluorescence recovery protein
MSSPSKPNPYPHQSEPIWSRSERAIARTAFDAALGRELHNVIQEPKRMDNEIQKSSDLWDLEHHRTPRHKEIEHKYDFHSSRLTQMFGRFLHERRLSEQELRGLRRTS